MIAFSSVFFVAFVYMVARGALDWGPMKRANGSSEIFDAPALTPRGTVRVVGGEGRASGNGRAA